MNPRSVYTYAPVTPFGASCQPRPPQSHSFSGDTPWSLGSARPAAAAPFDLPRSGVQRPPMVRALTTLVGLAAAAAILYFVTDVGDNGGSYWTRALRLGCRRARPRDLLPGRRSPLPGFPGEHADAPARLSPVDRALGSARRGGRGQPLVDVRPRARFPSRLVDRSLGGLASGVRVRVGPAPGVLADRAARRPGRSEPRQRGNCGDQPVDASGAAPARRRTTCRRRGAADGRDRATARRRRGTTDRGGRRTTSRRRGVPGGCG